MKILLRGTVSIFLAMILFMSFIPVTSFNASAVYYKPGDIITFGSYPQTRVKDIAVINALDARMSPVDNPVNYLGAKYKKVFFAQYTPCNSRLEPSAENSYQDDNGYYINTSYWFKYEPIKWRVLSNTNGELFVMSEKILDAKPYNGKYDKATWETCSMRSWLKTDFYKTAFSLIESKRILTTTVVNDDNPFYKTEGGSDTKDSVFLLSYKEVTNQDYGFSSSTSTTEETRKAAGSDYAKCAGLYVDRDAGSFMGNSYWWLRSPGSDASRAGYIHYMPIDMIGAFYYGKDVDYNDVGVRPVVKLKGLSILCATDNPGFVTDNVNQTIYGLEEGTTKSVFESSMQLDGSTRFEYTPDTGVLGTGTRVDLIDSATNEILETYKVVIFGDVNGDGVIDLNDEGMIVDIGNYALPEWDPETDAAFITAGDIFRDGIIDENDAAAIIGVQNNTMAVDQVAGIAVLV